MPRYDLTTSTCSLFHKIPEIAHKELGVQFSKEGNIPTAMVIMERRDLHLKKSVD